MPQSDNCHKDRAPTVNKAIIVSRHVGRRYPTTNQRITKMIVIMMIMIIVIIIIINIIMSMGLPNTPSRSKHAGGNHPTHTTPQKGTTPHPGGGGGRGRGPAEPDHACMPCFRRVVLARLQRDPGHGFRGACLGSCGALLSGP